MAADQGAASEQECPACRPVDDHPQAAMQCTRDEGCILKEALAAAPVAATTSAWRRFRADMGCSKSVAKFNTVECQNRRWWRAKHAHQDGLRRRYRRLAVAKKKVAA